jgi:hypothetical protein
MNPFFDAARFGRLMRSHWAENRRTYGWFAAVAAIVDAIVIVLFFAGGATSNEYGAFEFSEQVVWFATGLFITAPIFAARYFENLGSTGAALVTLMRPASIFEKWLMALVWVGLLFPLAYTALYALLHFPSVSLAHALREAYELQNPETTSVRNFDFYIPFIHYGGWVEDAVAAKKFVVREMFVALLVSGLQAFCVACKVYFKKAAALKTALLAFVLMLLVLGVPAVLDLNPMRFATYWLHSHEQGVQFSVWERVLALAVLPGVPVLLWWAVYVNLQEREVN